MGGLVYKPNNPEEISRVVCKPYMTWSIKNKKISNMVNMVATTLKPVPVMWMFVARALGTEFI